MHIHSVYFWLPETLSGEDLAEFEQGLAALCADTAVSEGYYGRAADIDRPVVDSSYTFGLILIFEDMQAHDQYQVGPIHSAFLRQNAPKWTRILVYDLQTV
jgi:hypothetical protein